MNKKQKEEWNKVVKDLRLKPERVMVLVPSPKNDVVGTRGKSHSSLSVQKPLMLQVSLTDKLATEK